MQPLKMKTTVGRVGRGLVLTGALAVGAGLTLVAVSQPSKVLGQKSIQAEVYDAPETGKPSEFETSLRAEQLNLSDAQKTRIRAIETASAQREKSLTEQLRMLEQTANETSTLQRGDDDAWRQSGLSRARAALKFDLESRPARAQQEIRRTLTVGQRAKLAAE